MSAKEHKILENEANLFAGVLLLPVDAVLDDLNAVACPTNPDAYLDLMKKWKTPLQVLGIEQLT